MPIGIRRSIAATLSLLCAMALLSASVRCAAEEENPNPDQPPQAQPFSVPPEMTPEKSENPQAPQLQGPPAPPGANKPAPEIPPGPEVQITPAPHTANAPGSVYQLDFLTPGGLRAPSELTSPAPKPLPSGAEHGLNLGAVRLYPGMSYDLTYSDNSLHTEKQNKRDELEEFGPNIAMTARPAENVTINAAYAFLWHDYIHNTANDYFSHSAVGTIAIKDIFCTPGLNFTLGDTYLQTGNTNVLETEIISFTRFATNRAFGALSYNGERLKVTARYDFDNLSYFSHPQDTANVHDQAGTLDAAYRLDDTFELFTTYSILRTYHDTVAPTFPKDEDRHTLEMGFVAHFEHFSFSAAGGYTASQIIYNGPQDDGAVATASVNYKYNEHLTVGGYGGVGISQNAREGRIIGQSRDLVLEGQGREPVSFGAYANYRPFQHVRLSANIDKTVSTGVLTGTTRDLLFGVSSQLLLTEKAHIDSTIFRDYSTSTGSRFTTDSFSTSAGYDLSRKLTLLFSFQRTDIKNDRSEHRNTTDEGRVGFRLQW